VVQNQTKRKMRNLILKRLNLQMYLAVFWILICLKTSVKMMTFLTMMKQRRKKFPYPHHAEEEAAGEEEEEEETKISVNLLVMDVEEKLRDQIAEEEGELAVVVAMEREEGEIKDTFKISGMRSKNLATLTKTRKLRSQKP